MFEVKLVVKDRALGDVLRALKPYALEPPVVIPVDGVEESSVNVGMSSKRTVKSPKERVTKPPVRREGSRVGRGPNRMTAVDILRQEIKNAPDLKEIRLQHVNKLVGVYGYKPAAAYWACKMMVKEGFLQPDGEQRGLYKVISHG